MGDCRERDPDRPVTGATSARARSAIVESNYQRGAAPRDSKMRSDRTREESAILLASIPLGAGGHRCTLRRLSNRVLSGGSYRGPFRISISSAGAGRYDPDLTRNAWGGASVLAISSAFTDAGAAATGETTARCAKLVRS